MPYSGPGDTSLPPYVQDMAEDSRNHWIGAFNGAFDHCRSSGDSDCEGYAFRVANAAVGGKGMTVKAALHRTLDRVLGAGQKQAESLTNQVNAVSDAVYSRFNSPDALIYHDVYVLDTLPDRVIISVDSKLYQLGYTKAEDGTITLDSADPVPVEIQYNPVTPSAPADTTSSDTTASTDSAASSDTTAATPADTSSSDSGTSSDTQASDMPMEEMKGYTPVVSGLTFKVDKQGHLRWWAIVSNNYKDREAEIITEAAHMEYVASVKAKQTPYPELWLWHIKGTRFGQADLVFYENGMLVETGTIDKGKERVAEKLATMKNLGVSHGFRCIKQGRDITWYRQDEVSVLPLTSAANVLTTFKVGGSTTMDADTRSFLDTVLGSEGTKSIEQAIVANGAVARAAGLESKELARVQATATDPQVVAALAQIGTKAEETAKAVDTIAKSLESVTSTVATLAETVKALSMSDEQKVLAKFAPRANGGSTGFRPTSSPETVVSQDTVHSVLSAVKAQVSVDDIIERSMKAANGAQA